MNLNVLSTPDFYCIIKKYRAKYWGLSPEEFNSAKLIALWKATNKHKVGAGARLSDSFGRYFRWELAGVARQNNFVYQPLSANLFKKTSSLADYATKTDDLFLLKQVFEYKNSLSTIAKECGVTRQAARKRLNKLLNRLRAVYIQGEI